MELGEQCDDGNLKNGDECEENCENKLLDVLLEEEIKTDLIEVIPAEKPQINQEKVFSEENVQTTEKQENT